MPIRPPEFDAAAQALLPVLDGLPPKVISIDGRLGAGKTTLGRFLAWYFNSTLLETDLFLEAPMQRNTEEVGRIIRFRQRVRRPVFVEGAGVLQVLDTLGIDPDFQIYVVNSRRPAGAGWGKELTVYDRTYRPMERADFVVSLDHGD